MRRVLLIQKAADKKDAKPEEIKKSFRTMGVTACQQMQGKKASDVEFLVSSKVGSSELLGIFENSFHLTNYENSHKKQPSEEEQEKDKEEEALDKDDRTKRINKKVDNFVVSTENTSVVEDQDYKFQQASARATEFARNLANARGSVATPEWMEHQIMDLLKKHEGKVGEVRVLQADELQKLGMNLFYNVGKGAISQPRCVIVHYEGNPEKKGEVEIALVGKGVTFDTGGLNLKPSGYMEDMYGDKGGSCAVLGAL
mmetsp:Transcript_9301/g.15672  ORF Transcript_9301/g.15672 Transcript_9301/m.15672 type:complete len:256 (+) Transcript_9301:346-1113(+)